ncbi:MAG: CopD family protein, partial [Deltaproteobacteria bacterium]|nr:CopD family protein [Nannocystaceae bacterium]
DLEAGRCRLTSRQCRLLNEVPTVLLLLIVIMAVVKPFG